VPDIPNKLIKPPLRNSLARQRKDFWDIVIQHNGPVNCIYTNKQLAIGDCAVEQLFLMRQTAFYDTPIDEYCGLQLLGLKTVLNNARNTDTEKLLQDYLTFILDLADFVNLDAQLLRTKFKDNVEPWITISSDNGFELMTN
jgi:hypothetical protein